MADWKDYPDQMSDGAPGAAFDAATDPPRAPELADALRALGSQPPLDSVDWWSLARRVHEAAERPLARRRAPGAWWLYAAAWAGKAIPVGLAASAALFVGLGVFPSRHERTTGDFASAIAPADAPAEPTLTTVLGDALEGLFPADRDELLHAAVFFEEY
jgi:hypothetical protein